MPSTSVERLVWTSSSLIQMKNLHAIEYKHEAADLNEEIAYPDEKFHLEEYKGCIPLIFLLTFV